MTSTLSKFLSNNMSMTEVYQPVIIRELLRCNGQCTKTDLAAVLARYDLSILDYYKKIVMRWPKITLAKHDIISYQKEGEIFKLNSEIYDANNIGVEVEICSNKIEEWIDKKKNKEKSPRANESLRYKILKLAHGKCELCGIPSSLRPIDVDHIEPESTKNKNGQVKKDGKWIDVHSEENLQALCSKCNRAKRATDNTDFRRTKKLIRDNIPDFIRRDGRNPIIKRLKGIDLLNALKEKLIEEHEEFISESNSTKSVHELADMLEVILSIARYNGCNIDELFEIAEIKKKENGGFEEGFFYEGDYG
ncbi:HNH endonuclease [Allohahella marinimesophila]|uniref:HNH nuclease domain-containing protein n=1 Tax=Allohahella marinimesophila TaxID=1054972 RepID=A0ABP7Q786_9GAMM